jgi:pantoate--beta-alanine ligase
MQVIHSISELRGAISSFKMTGETIGFVPTMGNLHAGHLDLVGQSLSKANRTVVSIFVNPTQFDQSSDLEAYPRTMEADLAQLDEIGVDLVFAPKAKEMYPQGGLVTEVDVPNISALHEGSSRPGHFRGVATVVCKLFNIVAADIAIFGQKDFQQLSLIRQMVSDLDIPIQIIGASTVREDDGLAMSSRNGRLTLEQREIAPSLYRVLRQVKKAALTSSGEYEGAQNEAMLELSDLGFKPDYIQVCNAETLKAATKDDDNLVILAAAYLGDVRLIDNLQFTLS